MKSLRRKRSPKYHQYLRSAQWHARRRAWFKEHADKDGNVGCVVCRIRLTVHTCQLHHVEYRGVVETSTGWISREADDDLMPFCSHDHEQLHKLFDVDGGWKRLGRRGATEMAVGKLQRSLARKLQARMAAEGARAASDS